jgi:hypothetical protein
VRGYYRLLESIKNHNNKLELELTGSAYDSEGFDIHKIHFDSPEDRLDLAFNR